MVANVLATQYITELCQCIEGFIVVANVLATQHITELCQCIEGFMVR